MAKRTTVELVDDLDGSKADVTLTFGLDGVTYEIDLSSEHADALGAALQRFIGAARRTSGRRTASARGRAGIGTTGSSSSSAGDIRDWAANQGIKVSSRGRIAADVQQQYDAAR